MKTKKELEEWSYPRRDGYNRCKKDIKKLIDELKNNKRFKQTAEELRDELDIYNVRVIQRFQLILTEIYMKIEELKARIEGK